MSCIPSCIRVLEGNSKIGPTYFFKWTCTRRVVGRQCYRQEQIKSAARQTHEVRGEGMGLVQCGDSIRKVPEVPGVRKNLLVVGMIADNGSLINFCAGQLLDHEREKINNSDSWGDLRPVHQTLLILSTGKTDRSTTNQRRYCRTIPPRLSATTDSDIQASKCSTNFPRWTPAKTCHMS